MERRARPERQRSCRTTVRRRAQVIQNGTLTTLPTHTAAVRWNSLLPCGGEIIIAGAARQGAGAGGLQADGAPGTRLRRAGRRGRCALRGAGRADRRLASDRRADVTCPWRAGLALRLGLELVADAEACLDERVLRGVAVDLLAESPHEDVDGPVAVGLASPPDLLQELVARDDTAAVEGERVEQLELGRASARHSCRRRTPAPLSGRCAAPRSRSHRRAALPAAAHPGGPRPRRVRRALASRTASRGSRRRRSPAHARDRARCRARRRPRSACRSPLRARSRSASSRRAPAASGRARRRLGSRTGASRARARRGRPRSGRIPPPRGAWPSRPRSRCRPRRSGSWPHPYDSREVGSVRVSGW